MSIYELTDANGRRLRIVLGWGSPVCNQANLFGNPFAAQAFVDALDPDIRSAIHQRFMEAFRDQPRHINAPMGAPALCGRSDPNQIFLSPDAKLTRAIANSELLVQPDDSLLPVDDNRAELRMKIRMQLNSMLADERREAALYQAQMDQESTFSKGLIYTGAFFHGLGTAAWDTLKWAKEVSDLGNPVVQLRNMFNAAYDAYGEDQVVESFAKNLQAAQWREIVEALGFDPSKITSEMIAQAMDAADVIWEDKTLRQDLTNFAWDYVKAQHAVELTQMGGGAALEIVITAILAALTAGAGLAAATAAKARHLPKLRKLGDLLLEFVDQSKKLGRYLKEKAKRAAKGEKGKPLDAEPAVERVNEPPRANNSANAIKHDEIPITQEKFDEIINLENPNRPDDVTEYLPESYVDAHLKKFNDEGAGFIVIEDWISDPKHKSFPDKDKFVGLSSEMDELIGDYKASGGDWTILRDRLALGESADLSDSKISYVKLFPNDERFKYSMPTGNERGAYAGEWTPGGYTKAGTREATLTGGDIIVHNNNLQDLNKVPGIYVETIK